MEELSLDRSESEHLAVDFCSRYIRLQLQKKALQEDVKSLRHEFEEQGLPTRQVITALNRLRKELKDGQSSELEVQTFKDWLESNTDVRNSITELDAKA